MDSQLWASKDPKPLRSGIPRDSALDVRVKDLSMRVKALQFLANDDWEYYETVADDDWDEYETVATKMNTGVSSSNDMEEKAAEEEKSSEPEPLLLSRVYHHPQALRVACLSDMRYNPLDFTSLLDDRQKPLHPSSTSPAQQYSLEDKEIDSAMQTIFQCWKTRPRKAVATLQNWARAYDRFQSDEGKEALTSLMNSFLKEIIDPQLPFWRNTDNNVFKSPKLRGKLISAFAKNLDVLPNDGKSTPLGEAMGIAASEHQEDRFAEWFERQGIAHWTPERGAAATRAGFNDAIFFLTENDIAEEQEQKYGHRINTPDFVFVDPDRQPLKVPTRLSRRSDLREHPVEVTVVEVKGFVPLPGLTRPDDWEKVIDQVHRYSEGFISREGYQMKAFGPTLLLMKEGISKAALKSLVDRTPRACVATFLPRALPKIPMINNPFKCSKKDNDRPSQSELESLNIWATRGPQGQSARHDRQALDDLISRAMPDLLPVFRQRAGQITEQLLMAGSSHPRRDPILGGWKGRMLKRHLQDAQKAEVERRNQATAAQQEEAQWRLQQEAGADVDDWEQLAGEGTDNDGPEDPAPALAQFGLGLFQTALPSSP